MKRGWDWEDGDNEDKRNKKRKEWNTLKGGQKNSMQEWVGGREHICIIRKNKSRGNKHTKIRDILKVYFITHVH